MPASAEYLTKYLTASNTKSANASADFEDSSRPKKRRKKDKPTTLVIDDDADLLLSNQHSTNADEDEGPLVYQTKTRSAEFRKKKSSDWQTIHDSDARVEGARENDTAGEKDDADRILEDAAADLSRRQRAVDAEDAPAVVELEEGGGPRMSSGAKAGLQTAADTAALLAQEAERIEKEERLARHKKKKEGGGSVVKPEQDTVYRDATGRRIDVSLRRAEARTAELEKLRKAKEEQEQAMGDVQRQQKEQSKQDLDDAKFMTLARGVDDEDLNERQKEELRWDDPMAQYMAEKRAEAEAEEGRRNPRRRIDDAQTVKTKKKEYQGAAAPNRYGIRPGWRWDGVDRGNGFEKEWFQARGRKTRNENLEYQWAMDE